MSSPVLSDAPASPASTPPAPAGDAAPAGSRPPKKRMLIIVNPYATTVSVRLKNLVVYALQGRYDVTAVETRSRGHATELCREAATEDYDVVVAFGGDGTVNEVGSALVFGTASLGLFEIGERIGAG